MSESFKQYFSDKSRSDRALLLISWILKVNFFINLIIGVMTGNYIVFLRGLLPLFIVLLPFLLEKYYGISTPAFMDLLITLAFFLHQCGVVYGVYTIIPQFDMVTHFFSSFVLAFSITVILYLTDANLEDVKLNIPLIALFTISLTAMFGVIWEMGEALVDLLHLLPTPAQESLADTMQDLSFDMLGSIIVAILYYYTAKKGYFMEAMKETEMSIERLIGREAEKTERV